MDNTKYGECAKHPGNNMVNCCECEMEAHKTIELKWHTPVTPKWLKNFMKAMKKTETTKRYCTACAMEKNGVKFKKAPKHTCQ